VVETSPTDKTQITATAEIAAASPLAQIINEASPLILFFDALHLGTMDLRVKEFFYPQRETHKPFVLPPSLNDPKRSRRGDDQDDPSLLQWHNANEETRKNWMGAFTESKHNNPKLKLIIKQSKKALNVASPPSFNARIQIELIIQYGRHALTPDMTALLNTPPLLPSQEKAANPVDLLQVVQPIIQPENWVRASAAAHS
jgi:hypothetical protein